MAGTAQADFAVTSLGDSGPGTLRQAIANANANPDQDTITFASGLSGTIVSLTPDGNLVVDVEMPGPKYRVPFNPHDVELEALAELK